MCEFDDKARQWDSNPVHFQRSEAIARQITSNISLQPEMNALEFGAGTGILSVLLKDQLNHITLMDNSIEMVKMINKKTGDLYIRNFTPVHFDIEKEEYKSEPFDIIYSQMVLHHVSDIFLVLTRLTSLLKINGFIALADLYPEDGSFHDGEFNGHYGINPEEIKSMLQNLNYSDISYEKCFTIEKTYESGVTKQFPIFLIVARKVAQR